uniref:Uncharacterized protein n=1 Tax=Oryza nivara TaxID=4536 RepID=A0A0E0HMS4_ORYNI
MAVASPSRGKWPSCRAQSCVFHACPREPYGHGNSSASPGIPSIQYIYELLITNQIASLFDGSKFALAFVRGLDLFNLEHAYLCPGIKIYCIGEHLAIEMYILIWSSRLPMMYLGLDHY